jgi:hypothetical protein
MQTKAFAILLIAIICVHQYHASVFTALPVATTGLVLALVKGITNDVKKAVDDIIPDILQPSKWVFLQAEQTVSVKTGCLKAENEEEAQRFSDLHKAADKALKSETPEEFEQNLKIFNDSLVLNVQLSPAKFKACVPQEKEESQFFRKGVEFINSGRSQVLSAAKSIGSSALKIILVQSDSFFRKIGTKAFSLINPFN